LTKAALPSSGRAELKQSSWPKCRSWRRPIASSLDDCRNPVGMSLFRCRFGLPRREGL